MATISKRKNNYSVVYNYTDEKGESKQKWGTARSYKEALRRKAEVKNELLSGTYIPPTEQSVSEFLKDFVETYGEKKWGVSITGAAAYNDDSGTPYRDGSGRYWYREGNVVQIQATAHDLEGYVRNFNVSIHDGSDQGIGADFNFCSWNGKLNDMNRSYFNNYTVGPSSDSGQQWTRCILRARSCGEGLFSAYASVENRAGVYAQHNSAINTGLTVGVDGTAPTTPQIVFISGKSSGWSNQNTAFYLTGSTDSGSGFDHYEYSIDGGTWNRYSGSVTIINTGWHTIQGRAFDHVGNVSYSTAYTGIDREPPTCRASIAASDWHVEGSPLTLDYSDDLSGVATQQYSWSQSSMSTGSWQNYTNGQKLLPPR